MTRLSLADLAALHADRRLTKKERNAELRQHGYNPDGDDGLVYRSAFRRAMIAGHGPSKVLLWEWPEKDHAAWQELTGDAMSLADYRNLLAAVQADQERVGLTVERVRISVSEMRERLARHGLPNEPGGRAAALGMP